MFGRTEEQRRIANEIRSMNIDRMQEATRRMADYDQEQAGHRSELQKRCEAIGHIAASSGDNGFGTSWLRCGVCDARYEIKTG